MHECSIRARNRFLAYYLETQRIHFQDNGERLKEYKPTEPDRLVEVFDTIWKSPSHGTRFLADILHTLVWAQCLGNANHRTSILFLQGLMAALYVPFPWYSEDPGSGERFKAAVESFSDASHRLLDRQSEFGYSKQQLKKQHKELALKWVERQFGDQSRVETMIEPQRLMAFFS